MIAWRNFKNIFSRPLFTIIFRPEILKFHPYSILTWETMVGFVIYCVLRYCPTNLGIGPTFLNILSCIYVRDHCTVIYMTFSSKEFVNELNCCKDTSRSFLLWETPWYVLRFLKIRLTYTGCPIDLSSISISISNFSDCPIKKD